jgi:hypothetical protein
MRRKGAVDDCASAVWQGGSIVGKGVVARYVDEDGVVVVGHSSVRKAFVLGQAMENQLA